MSASEKIAFERFGRSLHLLIETAEDLRRVVELDEAHWVATGAPLANFNCDVTFLNLVDTDRNGRIMCFEIKDAVVWLLRNLRDTSGVAAGSGTLRLDGINTDQEEGRRIRDSAAKILARLGTPEAEEITLETVRRVKAQVEGTPVSEAGVVLPEAADQPEIRQFITDVVATVGGAPHPGGARGVAKEQLDRFLGDAAAWLEWNERGQIRAGRRSTEIMPLGARTAAAYSILACLGDKIEQYFAQCEAAAFDQRVARQVSPTDENLAGLDLADPTVIRQMLRDSPLAQPRADRTLSFSDRMNPYYAAAMAQLRAQAIEPVLGRPAPTVSDKDWEQVKAFFAAHKDWLAGKPGAAVEPLGAEKLRQYLDERFRKAVEVLIAESNKTAFVLDNIRLTEKLVLYQQELLRLANNFVSFPYLYDPHGRALFEMGTLVMDGRRFNLAVKAENRPEHSGVARNSSMFVLYVEVMAKDGSKRYDLAVPVTHGGKGNLCVGKRGIFEDVNGLEWDAKVVQIIENPISLTEALVSPFRRLGGIISGKIESIAAQAEKKLDTATAAVAAPAEKGPAAAGRPAGGGLMAGGLLMGGGVAIAALGSAAAYITKTLGGLDWWIILIGVGCAVLAVILPTSIVAFIKLRKRDLSAILEGSGWAINARMRLTRRQGRHFTQRPRYPSGAEGVHRPPWWLLVLVVLAALAVLGDQVRRKYKAPATKSASAPATQPGAEQP
ncbi:MAG: hypothetical protein AMJ81_01930 [Phycisphaerae bacterium SM23_33]|nr:MAG: hypothetical protein AMJ81_01930 [Phycisphaerae bacterium SM23_33]